MAITNVPFGRRKADPGYHREGEQADGHPACESGEATDARAGPSAGGRGVLAYSNRLCTVVYIVMAYAVIACIVMV